MHQRAGRSVRYLPPVGHTIERCRVSHVVFPRYASDETPQTVLTPLARSTGLQRLFAECVSVPRRIAPAEAGHVVEWARSLKFFDLTFADLSQALDAIDGLAANGA